MLCEIVWCVRCVHCVYWDFIEWIFYKWSWILFTMVKCPTENCEVSFVVDIYGSENTPHFEEWVHFLNSQVVSLIFFCLFNILHFLSAVNIFNWRSIFFPTLINSNLKRSLWIYLHVQYYRWNILEWNLFFIGPVWNNFSMGTIAE